jgi:hypothetical protein
LHFPWTHVPQALPGALPWEPGLSSTLASKSSGCLADSGANDTGKCCRLFLFAELRGARVQVAAFLARELRGDLRGLRW